MTHRRINSLPAPPLRAVENNGNKTISISVTILNDNSDLSFNCNAQQTIAALKKEIESRTAIPLTHQKLIFESRELIDSNQTLQQNRIRQHSRLLLQLRNSIKIFVEFSPTERRILNVSADYTLDELKAYLARQFAILPKYQLLFVKGNDLQQHSNVKLSRFGIEDNSTVNVIVNRRMIQMLRQKKAQINAKFRTVRQRYDELKAESQMNPRQSNIPIQNESNTNMVRFPTPTADLSVLRRVQQSNSCMSSEADTAVKKLDETMEKTNVQKWQQTICKDGAINVAAHRNSEADDNSPLVDSNGLRTEHKNLRQWVEEFEIFEETLEETQLDITEHTQLLTNFVASLDPQLTETQNKRDSLVETLKSQSEKREALKAEIVNKCEEYCAAVEKESQFLTEAKAAQLELQQLKNAIRSCANGVKKADNLMEELNNLNKKGQRYKSKSESDLDGFTNQFFSEWWLWQNPSDVAFFIQHNLDWYKEYIHKTPVDNCEQCCRRYLSGSQFDTYVGRQFATLQKSEYRQLGICDRGDSNIIHRKISDLKNKYPLNSQKILFTPELTPPPPELSPQNVLPDNDDSDRPTMERYLTRISSIDDEDVLSDIMTEGETVTKREAIMAMSQHMFVPPPPPPPPELPQSNDTREVVFDRAALSRPTQEFTPNDDDEKIVPTRAQSAGANPHLPQTTNERRQRPPDRYLCPISNEVMRSPVMSYRDGQTYDRNNIEQYMREHHRTPFESEHSDGDHGSPEDSFDSFLLSNPSLKAEIQQSGWLL